MRPSILRQAVSGLRGKRSLSSPLLLGLAIWAGFPTLVGRQDMASLISGTDGKSAVTFSSAAAGSVHRMEMRFTDDTLTGSISGSGVDVPGLGAVAFIGKSGIAGEKPDEERITRSEKKGRVIEVAPVAPPKSFNAGSIFKRTSLILRPGLGENVKMAFTGKRAAAKDIQIASAFHLKDLRGKATDLSVEIAAIATSDRGDSLALGYAPAEPDYAGQSPFAALLQEEAPSNGRFIPPVQKGDHAWMSTPLPASVFSAQEQRCLAAGVYFEARGEETLGQAAVAQVILNRVRNPTYPDSICGVVYQNENWRNSCQFSFACDGIKDRVESPSHWKTAEEVALAVTAGRIWIPEVGSSTHYHATYVKPGWARTMKRMKKIGLHIFYRTYGGGWS